MNPRIQCVLTQWKPGFIASGCGPIIMINSGSRPGESSRARWTRILVADPGARNPLLASLSSHCSALGLAARARD
jgi:hypothetical protein